MHFSLQKDICVGTGQDYLNMSRRDPNNTAANGWRSGENPVLATPGENFAKLRRGWSGRPDVGAGGYYWNMLKRPLRRRKFRKIAAGWSGLFNMGAGDYHHDSLGPALLPEKSSQKDRTGGGWRSKMTSVNGSWDSSEIWQDWYNGKWEEGRILHCPKNDKISQT
ncbi:hypothetical protein FSST1_009085 [Fusarium sambucinum]